MVSEATGHSMRHSRFGVTSGCHDVTTHRTWGVVRVSGCQGVRLLNRAGLCRQQDGATKRTKDYADNKMKPLKVRNKIK